MKTGNKLPPWKARKVLIAPDKFKGTLTAPEAADAMARGLRRFFEPALPEIILRPLADGGEGSHETLRALRSDLKEDHGDFPDCSGRPRNTPWLRDDRGSHYLETAKIVGLLLPGARELPVSRRNTRGIGLWLHERIHRDEQLHLFLGGSAVSDGGFGLAGALGFRFLGRDASPVETFRDVERAVRVEFPPDAPRARIVLYTDVSSPLVGPRGAARLFAGQKGADVNEIAQIDLRLTHMLKLFKAAREYEPAPAGSGLNETHGPPGSGAAGGMALPLLYWPGLDVRVESGIDFFLNQAGLPEMFRAAPPDLVITGEGASDRSTLQGKVVEGLRRLAGRVLVFSGAIHDRPELETAGYDFLTGTDEIMGPFHESGDDARAEAVRRLEQTVFQGLAKRETGG